MVENTRRSLQELSAEVATNPNSTAFVELAAAYRERGDLDRALRLSLRGLQRHPTHVEAHYELGRIYELRGERELALDEWGIVRQLAPDHLPSRLALIHLFIDEGRMADAENEVKAAWKISPDDAEVARLWKRVQAARAEGAGEEEAQPPTGELGKLPSGVGGMLGVLLVDAGGQVLDGRMTPDGVESDRMLGVTLSGAKKEAERVASYLDLGDVQGMVIESSVARLTMSTLGDGMIVVATVSELPAGQAARVVQRARAIAEANLGRKVR
jgi:tetratricopeptide (TPR) repeat protein